MVVKTSDLNEAIKILRDGGVIVYPTDTVYGIGCIIGNQNAVKRIREIKGIEGGKPLSLAFSGIWQARNYCRPNGLQFRKIMESISAEMIGNYEPFTYLVEKSERVPEYITGGSNKIGIRIPFHDAVRKITEKVGPIITTSANFHGEATPNSFEEINPLLLEKVDLALIGECKYKKASKITDLTDEKILRP